MIATIIIIVLFAANLGIAMCRHGAPKEGRYNFWMTLASVALYTVLLYYAGLFDKFIK